MRLDNEIEKSLFIVRRRHVPGRPQIYIMNLILLHSSSIISFSTIPATLSAHSEPSTALFTSLSSSKPNQTKCNSPLSSLSSPLPLRHRPTPSTLRRELELRLHQTHAATLPLPSAATRRKDPSAASCPSNLETATISTVRLAMDYGRVLLNVIRLVIGVLPLSSQCSPNQVVACCPNSGTQVSRRWSRDIFSDISMQTGLVNVGPVCAPVTL